MNKLIAILIIFIVYHSNAQTDNSTNFETNYYYNLNFNSFNNFKFGNYKAEWNISKSSRILTLKLYKGDFTDLRFFSIKESKLLPKDPDSFGTVVEMYLNDDKKLKIVQFPSRLIKLILFENLSKETYNYKNISVFSNYEQDKTIGIWEETLNSIIK